MDQNVFIREGTITNLFFPVFILLPLFSLLIILKTFSNYYSKRLPLPPGPYPWPILGNLFQIDGKNPHITITKLAKTYGPLFSFKLGTQLVVVGSSREAAIEILKVQDHNLSGRYVPHMAAAKSLDVNNLSIGWVLECNNSWRLARTICRNELFSTKALESQAFIREKKVAEMVEFIGTITMQGKVVKLRELAFATVFNMISNILASRDLLSLKGEVENGDMTDLIRNIVEIAVAPNISDYYQILSGLDLQSLKKKSMEVGVRFRKLWEPIVKERMEKKRSDDVSSQHDFLDVLINNGSSEIQINIMLMELMSAGTDTSAVTIEWTMAELIKNPEYMKKVEDELKREIGSEVIKESYLPKLPFLQACVKETLRLHPPGPFLLPHRATETCEVMNYTIPKNTLVAVNFWAIGKDPVIWKDPLVFKPERFLNSNIDFKGNDFEFIPFGAGRRICPGLPMVVKHVPIILAALIHSFDWSLPYGKDARELDMNEKYGLTMIKEQPLLLVPKAKI